MLLTYLRRELTRRRRQTIIVSVGLALAVALVMIVNATSAGVRDAQAGVLESVYGVGTDLTVSQVAEPGAGGPQRFGFGAEDGEATGDGGTALASERLDVAPGTATMDDGAVATAGGTDGVASVSAALELTALSFSGELPEPPSDITGESAVPDGEGGGRPRGFAGGDFDIDTTTVTGVEPGADALGPLSVARLAEGRGLEASDADAAVALLSTTYAETEELAVGATTTVGGTEVEVVGLLTSDGAAGSLADVYLPLALAQEIADLTGQVTTVYVQATSADAVEDVAAALGTALPDATVSTQADLASTVTGSLASASSLVGNLGTWLSVLVLAAAFVLAALFTVSGVTRRTRDFGTLKAIGWSDGRIVRQVGAEAAVQGLLGGVAGLVLGLVGIGIVNALGITLTGSTGALSFGGTAGGGLPEGLPGGAAGPFGGAGDALARFGTSAVDVVLTAPVNLTVVGIGIGLAVLGGLLAGTVGGWRAARLRPAAALRSVD